LIYSHKPQRSGRSITANTNNPPQDPPPPPDSIISESQITESQPQVIDIPIEDTTPISEICVKEEKIVTKIVTKPTLPKIVTKPTLPKIVTKPKVVKIIEKTQPKSWFSRVLKKFVWFFKRK
jgi:hypothetical protein